jgi:hypothetical protein
MNFKIYKLQNKIQLKVNNQMIFHLVSLIKLNIILNV